MQAIFHQKRNTMFSKTIQAYELIQQSKCLHPVHKFLAYIFTLKSGNEIIPAKIGSFSSLALSLHSDEGLIKEMEKSPRTEKEKCCKHFRNIYIALRHDTYYVFLFLISVDRVDLIHQQKLFLLPLMENNISLFFKCSCQSEQGVILRRINTASLLNTYQLV